MKKPIFQITNSSEETCEISDIKYDIQKEYLNIVVKDELFEVLCEETARISFCYEPKIYSVPWLSKLLYASQYHVRKLIKELEADGFVKKTFDGGVDEYGYPYCYHGYSITEKAKETDVYKECQIQALNDYNEFCKKHKEE